MPLSSPDPSAPARCLPPTSAQPRMRVSGPLHVPCVFLSAACAHTCSQFLVFINHISVHTERAPICTSRMQSGNTSSHPRRDPGAPSRNQGKQGNPHGVWLMVNSDTQGRFLAVTETEALRVQRMRTGGEAGEGQAGSPVPAPPPCCGRGSSPGTERVTRRGSARTTGSPCPGTHTSASRAFVSRLRAGRAAAAAGRLLAPAPQF